MKIATSQNIVMPHLSCQNFELISSLSYRRKPISLTLGR